MSHHLLCADKHADGLRIQRCLKEMCVNEETAMSYTAQMYELYENLEIQYAGDV